MANVTVAISALPSLPSVSSPADVLPIVDGGTTYKVTVAALLSTTGNITGSYFLGNGSQLSSITGANVTGTVANATFATSAGTATSATTAATVTGNAQANITSVGTLTSITSSGLISTTGNVAAINVFATAVSATGAVTGTSLTVSTGTVTAGNIVNGNGNGVGNIGTSSNYFNTVFAQATSAVYADLAEVYVSDAEYVPGTVVVFGGEAEITTTTEFADVAVAGVISTAPAYLMNSAVDGLPVALRGRVPVLVMGPVGKGDLLVASDNPGYAVSVGKNASYGVAVFAKSIQDKADDGVGTIEAVLI
jgi:hypothetical protein